MSVMEFAGVDKTAQAIDDVEVLELENALLCSHLSRLEVSAPAAHGTPPEAQLAAPLQQLSEEVKAGICSAEAAALADELSQLELASEAQLSELACRTTVAEQQAAGCQRDASDLERALNGGGPDRGEAVISGEALLRFLHERLKMKDVATAQCNLRSAALEGQLQKLSRDSQKKSAVGENLQPVDFEKARIENKQLLQANVTRQREASDLKLIAGSSAQALSDCRTELAVQTAEIAATEKQIEELAAQLARCQSVCEATERECAAGEKEMQSLQQRASDAEDRPTVLEYVRLTAEVRDLQKVHRAWERKLAGLQGSPKKLSPAKQRPTGSGTPQGQPPPPAHGVQSRVCRPQLRRLQDRATPPRTHAELPVLLPAVKGHSVGLHRKLSSE